jgi:hypothetical protein
MTQTINRRRWAMTFAAPWALAILAGCATTGGAPAVSAEDDKAAVLQRAKAYWELVRVNDKVGAWSYEAASKDRSMTIEGYIKRGGITYEAVEVRNVRSVDDDEAVVDVWMRYGVPLLRIKSQETVAQDRWRRVDGVWHHVLRRPTDDAASKP